MSSEQSRRSFESSHFDQQALAPNENDDSQQREILRRLAECELKPHLLVSFDEADLEAMIHKISRRE